MRKSLQHTATLVLLLMLSLIPAALRAEDITQDNRRCVYIVGGYQSADTQWASPLAIPENEEALKPYRLYETAPGSNVYTGSPSMYVPIGTGFTFNYFWIYTALNEPKPDDSHLRNNVVGVNSSEIVGRYDSDGFMRFPSRLANNESIEPFRSGDGTFGWPYIRLDLNENELFIDNQHIRYIVGDFNKDIAPTYSNIGDMRQWSFGDSYYPIVVDLPAGNHELRILTKLVDDGETPLTYGPSSEFTGDWSVANLPVDRVVEWDAQGLFSNEQLYEGDGESFTFRRVALSEGKSSWLLNDWPGGKLLISRDGEMRNLTTVDKIYLVGYFTGWREPSAENADYYQDWTLVETSPGSGIFKGSFYLPEGGRYATYFGLYHALTGWERNPMGSIGRYGNWNDGHCLVFDSDGYAEAALTFGSDTRLELGNWTGGDVTFTFDMNAMRLKIDTDPSHETKYVAIMGDINQDVSWAPVPGNESSYNIMLETYAGSGIYSSSEMYIPAGQFRINFIPGFTADGINAPTIAPSDKDCELEWGKDGYARSESTRWSGGNGGYWTVSDWDGGWVTMTVNPATGDVSFYCVDKIVLDGIYLIGAPEGWVISPDEPEKWLLMKVDGTNRFTGTFYMAPGEAMFRFYKFLGDWESNSIGFQYDDYPVDIVMDEGRYYGIFVDGGKGAWNIPEWQGGEIECTVDFDNKTVQFVDLSSGLELNVVPAASIIPVAGGVRVSAPAAQQVAVYSVTGALVLQQAVGAGDTVIALPAGFYIVNGQKVAVR